MYDVQCTGCTFRAQVKTNNCKPKSEIFGAGWDIIEKVMKAGFVIPPLLANFKWRDKTGKHQLLSFCTEKPFEKAPTIADSSPSEL